MCTHCVANCMDRRSKELMFCSSHCYRLVESWAWGMHVFESCGRLLKYNTEYFEIGSIYVRSSCRLKGLNLSYGFSHEVDVYSETQVFAHECLS